MRVALSHLYVYSTDEVRTRARFLAADLSLPIFGYLVGASGDQTLRKHHDRLLSIKHLKSAPLDHSGTVPDTIETA